MARWILLRHGQSVANAEDWLAGHVDTPLTPLGIDQARAAGRALSELSLSRVLSSDLQRAADTARLAIQTWSQLRQCDVLPIQLRPALRERHTGQWAHRDRAQLRAAGLMSKLTSWTDAPPDGESQARLAARVLPALRDVADLDGDTLIVAHGGVLRIILATLNGTPRDQIGFFGVPNAQPIMADVSADALDAGARALGIPLV